jgi:hypothetical protein
MSARILAWSQRTQPHLLSTLEGWDRLLRSADRDFEPNSTK